MVSGALDPEHQSPELCRREFFHPEKGHRMPTRSRLPREASEKVKVKVREDLEVLRRSWGPVGKSFQEGGRGKHGEEPEVPSPRCHIRPPDLAASQGRGGTSNLRVPGSWRQEDADAPRQTRIKNQTSGPKMSEEGRAHLGLAPSLGLSSPWCLRKPMEDFSSRTRMWKRQVWTWSLRR